MSKLKIKTNTIIEINDVAIELTHDELISLRDELNKLTNFDVPAINFPNPYPMEIPFNPYVNPYDGTPQPYNPQPIESTWINPISNPNIIYY